MMESAPLLKQVTLYRGLLWFRSMDDGVCFCLRLADVRSALKHHHAVLRVTKSKTHTFSFGPFEARVDTLARITLPLSLPDLAPQRVPIARDWLIEMKPMLERALHIIDSRGSHEFTLTFDGGDVVEVELDRKSIPPNGGTE